MGLNYIHEALHSALRNTIPVEVKGQVTQVVGTIIRAIIPGVKIGEICTLKNPWDTLELEAEVVGFDRQAALLTPLGDIQGVSSSTEVIPSGSMHSVPVGPDLMGRVLDGLGRPADGGPALRPAASAHVPPHYRHPPAAGPACAGRPAHLRGRPAHGYFRGGRRR